MPASSEPEPLTSAWRAPGKLVLVGEYAVLDGAPALVVAVDRGVECEARARRGPPDAEGGPALQIETPDGDDRFVRPALTDRAAPGLYRFRAWNPVLGITGKPGFGGSAAACVAACLAAGRPATDAYAIHAAVQGGGSGIDVAASLHGGLLSFERPAAISGSPPLPVIGALAVPASALVVIWSGRSASTGPRVTQYAASPDRGAFVAEMRRIVAGWADDPVAALSAAGDALVRMSERAGIDYLTPAHARLRALARDHGGAAKPSGAGGGDIAVALFPDEDRRAAFVAAARAAGLPPIAVTVAPAAGPVSPGAPPHLSPEGASSDPRWA